MTYNTHTSAANSTMTFIEGVNAGPPLLLLHGVGRCAEDFSAVVEALESQFHIHAVDFRGHGNSDRKPGRYLVNNYAEDIFGFLGSRFDEPVILCGHSLGAMVALKVAAEWPDLVRAVILEDPPFQTMGRNLMATPWHALFSGMRDAARQSSVERRIEQSLSELSVPMPDGAPATTLGKLRSRESLRFSARCLAKVDPEVFTPIINQHWLDGYDERPLFERIDCPVLLMQGDPSLGAALTDRDAMLALNGHTNRQLVRFSGTGHLIHREQPETFLRYLNAFVGGYAPLRTSSLANSRRGRNNLLVRQN